MQFKIGIFGSAEDSKDTVIKKARALGTALAEKDVILLTGASIGLPYEVAMQAHKKGKEIWGFSLATNLQNQQKAFPDTDSSIYKKLIYIPKDYMFKNDLLICQKYRNVTSTATCDAGIIISGRWGTMNEFTNLHDMGKVIGVLTGTGGIADELAQLLQKISKISNAKIIFSDSPKVLVEKVLDELQLRT